MSAPLFDTHAHYCDPRFASEYEGGADRLISRVFESGVGAVINVAVDLPSAELCVAQARGYENMYAAAGFHPCDSARYPDMDRALGKLSAMLEKRAEYKIKAVGEIGLDYHYEAADGKEGSAAERTRQKQWFDAQLELAEKYSLPVIVHDRDAHGDCLDVVKTHRNARGVFHAYSGSAETARELVKMGWYIAFGGVLTFKNADRVRSVAATVPPERLLVETDCPYLAPSPHRGELNDSSLMKYTVAALAELRGLSFDECADLTYKNAARLFS